MASRLTVVLTILLVGIVISCGRDKAPPTADPERLSSLPQFDGTEMPTNDSSDLTITDIAQAASNADLTRYTGRSYQQVSEKGLSLFLEQVEPKEREINVKFEAHVLLANTTMEYTPENPHDVDVEIELLVSGALALSKPGYKLFSGGFLGIGAQPPMASWGAMIKDHYDYIILGKPYLAIIPGLCIMSLVMAFMLIGNTLRDALDVKS